jgi:Glycosyltransferases involved in cell wall biogenesis
MKDFINIVIPVYNEGENILSTLSEIERKVSTKHQIFVVYDFEGDDTLPVLRGQPFQHLHLIKNKYGRGVLNAIKTGFESAQEGAVLVVMADLSDDLAKVDEMFRKINEGYDIVCGSRYMKGGRQIGGPWFKKQLSRVAGLSLHYFAGIPTHDVTNSFKMYAKKVLEDIQIESNGGFELGMEILIKAHQKGFRITEIPSLWRDRDAGQSKFKLWQWLPKYLHWYWFALTKGKSN